MPTEKLVLCGAGGHAKVVYDAIRCSGDFATIEVRDDDPSLVGRTFLDVQIAGLICSWNARDENVHVAIGDNTLRLRVLDALTAGGALPITVIHPLASVSPLSRLDVGGFVAAFARVSPGAFVGKGAIVNHSSIVDHDCIVKAYTHVAPGVILGGGAIVGECSLLGAGCIVLPGTKVGKHSVVGAGAVVTRDVRDYECVVGVPARSQGFVNVPQ